MVRTFTIVPLCRKLRDAGLKGTFPAFLMELPRLTELYAALPLASTCRGVQFHLAITVPPLGLSGHCHDTATSSHGCQGHTTQRSQYPFGCGAGQPWCGGTGLSVGQDGAYTGTGLIAGQDGALVSLEWTADASWMGTG